MPSEARGNMRCFGNLIVIFSYVLYNILYSIMKRFSFIRGWKLKPYVQFVCLFYLFVLDETLFLLPLTQHD